jgi:hypothetical protein
MLDKIYIVCNSSLSQKFKAIPQFKLNLGVSLIDSSTKSVNTQDVIIQKHHMYHSQIIQMIGFIGSLPIYSHPSHSSSILSICCDEKKIDYSIGNEGIYNEINHGLNLMFTLLGKNKPEIVEVKEIKPEKKEYIMPDKKLNELSMAERIAYARNIK